MHLRGETNFATRKKFIEDTVTSVEVRGQKILKYPRYLSIDLEFEVRARINRILVRAFESKIKWYPVEH